MSLRRTRSAKLDKDIAVTRGRVKMRKTPEPTAPTPEPEVPPTQEPTDAAWARIPSFTVDMGMPPESYRRLEEAVADWSGSLPDIGGLRQEMARQRDAELQRRSATPRLVEPSEAMRIMGMHEPGVATDLSSINVTNNLRYAGHSDADFGSYLGNSPVRLSVPVSDGVGFTVDGYCRHTDPLGEIAGAAMRFQLMHRLPTALAALQERFPDASFYRSFAIVNPAGDTVVISALRALGLLHITGVSLRNMYVYPPVTDRTGARDITGPISHMIFQVMTAGSQDLRHFFRP